MTGWTIKQIKVNKRPLGTRGFDVKYQVIKDGMAMLPIYEWVFATPAEAVKKIGEQK